MATGLLMAMAPIRVEGRNVSHLSGRIIGLEFSRMTKFEPVLEEAPVRQRSAAAEVQAQLQAHIEAGQYRRNERLPSESELAKQFRVSRPVIREALTRLHALGLTASQTGKGTFVLSDRVRPPLLMGLYSPAHIREVRRCIEIPSARLAAERRTDRDIG